MDSLERAGQFGFLRPGFLRACSGHCHAPFGAQFWYPGQTQGEWLEAGPRANAESGQRPFEEDWDASSGGGGSTAEVSNTSTHLF